jgi:hypothetical protein
MQKAAFTKARKASLCEAILLLSFSDFFDVEANGGYIARQDVVAKFSISTA